MTNAFLQIATTSAVAAAQTTNASRHAYARLETGPLVNDRLGETEIAFIAERDSFYMATVSETGWPYVQHRGGARGFLKVLGPTALAIADYRGNRQYVSLGNLSGNDRAALILLDYASRHRLKLFARVEALDLGQHPELAQVVSTPNEKVFAERAFLFHVEAFDWNCTQHITPRFSQDEVSLAMQGLSRELAGLKAENAALRLRLAELGGNGA